MAERPPHLDEHQLRRQATELLRYLDEAEEAISDEMPEPRRKSAGTVGRRSYIPQQRSKTTYVSLSVPISESLSDRLTEMARVTEAAFIRRALEVAIDGGREVAHPLNQESDIRWLISESCVVLRTNSTFRQSRIQRPRFV